jgi:hypothetical protein
MIADKIGEESIRGVQRTFRSYIRERSDSQPRSTIRSGVYDQVEDRVADAIRALVWSHVAALVELPVEEQVLYHVRSRVWAHVADEWES